MSNLCHLIYASRAKVEFTKEDLIALLDTAKHNNEKIDITGMLLYCEGSFLQILEGEPKTVNELFNKIGRDPRHADTIKIIEESIEERRFPDWSMGFKGITKKDFLSVEGLNDFYRFNRCLTQLDESRAKTVLQAFSEGRWHV